MHLHYAAVIYLKDSQNSLCKSYHPVSFKGINPTMGGTLANGTDTTEAYPVTQDVYGFSLHYYKNDYRAIGYSPKPAGVLGALTTNAAPLFNGNIAAMAVNIPQLSATRVYNYHYDQLNRIVAMDMYNGLNPNAGTFTPAGDTSYKERVSYDPNGNILGYLRNGNIGSTMDSLNYTYYANTNQLSQVKDKVSATKYTTDIDNQNANNYTYDATGNMISAASDSISNITWNVYGKIATITKNAIQIKYTYDASGNRIMKQTPTDTTVYVRDAIGNVMSVYYKPVNGTLVQSEIHLYGSSRLGMATQHLAHDTSVVLNGGFSNGIKSIFTRGEKLFELSNHLGNVLATISDRRLQVDSDSDGMVDNYKADIISANNYYPFGMLLPKEIPDSTIISSGFDAGLDGWAVYNVGTVTNDNGRLKFSGSQVWSTLKKDLQLVTGKQYRVRFTIDMGNCHNLSVPVYKSDISTYVMLEGIGSLTTSGTYEGTFTATSNSMLLLFEMVPTGNPPPDSTGYYWLDNVSVEEIKAGDSTHVGKGGYRYGFNGKELDKEVSSTTTYDYGFRIYNPALGKFLSVDPLTKSYPWYTPYQFAGNKPVACIDLDGLEELWITNNCFAPYDLFGSDLLGSYSGDGKKRKFGDGGTYRTSGKAHINLNTAEEPTFVAGSTTSSYHRKFGSDYSHKSDSKIQDESYFASSDKSFFHLQMHISGGNKAAAVAADIDNHLNIYFEKNPQDKSKVLVHGFVQGDRFPSNETILSDKNGNQLILGVSGPNSILGSGKNAGPYLNLPGDNKRNMQKFSMTILFKEDQTFKAVEFGGKQYSIEEWNKQFTKLDPNDSNVSTTTTNDGKIETKKSD